MSYQLGTSSTARPDPYEEDSSSSSEDDDNTFDDWVESDTPAQPCRSLFEEKLFPTATEAIDYDKKTFQFDINQICSNNSLDFHDRIRLINYIRKNKPAPSEVTNVLKSKSVYSSDEYLIPVIEDDPLLQFQSDDWSDDEIDVPVGDNVDPQLKIKALEKQLQRAKQEYEDYRSFVGERLEKSDILAQINSEPLSTDGPARDDDTHYFESYAQNDIHAVMIQDKVRTSTYASFILKSPELFRDAVVLDVGCGTGILSLFAAKSGAKRVISVDASDIAEKAREIVQNNDLQDVITVVRGKIEDITLPDGIEKVDVIISEWMGYALLYESMLDSVLRARDRFLKPNGVLAPSQCHMMLSLCEGSELFKERIGFWGDVYGFDLSPMAAGVYDEAVVDVVSPESLVSKPCIVKDLYLRDITTRQLDFVSPFSLTSTSDRRIKIHALVLYFDTFFTRSGSPIPGETKVEIIKSEDAITAEVWPVGGKPNPLRRQSMNYKLGSEVKEKVTSFSTGPESIPTHWKQTLFFLRKPIVAEEGTTVSGTFHLKKSESNSRELDVEIHYSVTKNDEVSGTTVQLYKVR